LKKYIILLIFLFSCVKEAIIFKGNFNTIILSIGNLKRTKGFIKNIFEKEQFTPREEKIFEIFEFDSLKKNERFLYRYYIIVSTPTSKNFKFFKSIFGEVKNSGIYIKESPFLLGSFVMGIYGGREEEILRIIFKKKDTIFKIFYNKMLSNLREIAYFPGIREDLSKKVKEKTGIKIKIPKGYNLFKEGENYIVFVRHYPDRFVFFWKIDKKINLVPEEVAKLRNKFSREIYAGDSVIMKFLKYDYKKINGNVALYLAGVWGNYNLKVGGGFESLVIERNGKTYFIDIGVHEPRKWKIKYLKMMESWAFSPEFENEKDN